MKVTTKLAKNGARLYYVDSKRVSRDKALEIAAQNRVGNPFVIEYDTEQNHYLIQGGIEKHIYTDRRTFDKLNIRIDNYHGFTVYCGTCQLRTFACNFGAKNFAATIEDAFINGEHGIKITVDGKISILPAENVGNLTDSALAASNSRLAAFRTNDTATEIDASEYAISQAAFDIAVKAERDNAFNAKPSLERYKSARCSINHTIDKRGRHMWFDSYGIIRKQEAADILSVYYGLTVDEYLACEKIAEAEYLSKLDAVFNARDVEELAAEYAVTVDAQDVATVAEIELANAVTVEAQDSAVDADEDELADTTDMDGVTYCNGEFFSVRSNKYHAEFSKDFNGKIHYFIFDEDEADFSDDEDYNIWDYEVSREKFFSVLKQRGAFTDAETEQTTETPRITDKDFLNEATFTMTATEAAKAVSTLVDNFRHMGNFHEVTLSKPDNEVLWKRTFRGTGNGTTYLIEEVLNHPDGTLREVWIRGDVNYMGIVTIKISDNNEQATDTGDKVNTDRRELIIGEETERVCVTISVKDCFNADNEDDSELLADLEHEIDWIPDVIRYRVDAEAGVCATASDDDAIRSIEELFDKYGLNYSRYVFREKVTVVNEPEPEPPVTAEEREEMNAAVRKFAHTMKDNYEQCRRAEQAEAQAPVVPLTGLISVDSGAKAFALVGEYFPNGLAFKCRTEGFNGEDVFTFTDGNEMFLSAICTTDNRRIELLQVVNSNESGSKRKPLNLIVDKKKKTAIITIVEFVYCLRGDDFMANLGVTRYGITVGWDIASGDGKVSKTYNGLNFTSDVASVKAAEASDFVVGLESMASLTSAEYSAETVDVNQNNAVENRGA